MTRPVLLKLGGELLERADATRAVAQAIAAAAEHAPIVIVHGGGKEIDAALAKAGIAKHQVDGIRITDQPTLDVVVSVMAGAINTRLVAAINAAGGRAVGLTGADAAVAPVDPMPPFRTVAGDEVSLGLVGQPSMDSVPHLLTHLLAGGYIPVVATIGAGADGTLYNVNADTMAAALAVRLKASRLLIAGTTAGVLGANGKTLAEVDEAAEQALVSGGTVNRGMLAKLGACRTALAGGVDDVVIVDGRDAARLGSMMAWAGAAHEAMTRVL
ncbi:MAG: acetylglutamate kinase [Acidobacteria bacterium]|nr:acetylglutamate kinase [Acidobacteriota bacterium]